MLSVTSNLGTLFGRYLYIVEAVKLNGFGEHYLYEFTYVRDQIIKELLSDPERYKVFDNPPQILSRLGVPRKEMIEILKEMNYSDLEIVKFVEENDVV